MSINQIKEKLLDSIKNELYSEENKSLLEDELLKPLINKILDQMYPYILWTSLFFMFMFVFIMVILFLNIRVYMYK
tara:strand:- start:88 stop:315 length:228 start_codon:yes stop_codon:yes gene_type:complete